MLVFRGSSLTVQGRVALTWGYWSRCAEDHLPQALGKVVWVRCQQARGPVPVVYVVYAVRVVLRDKCVVFSDNKPACAWLCCVLT
jgi:hypothetical protein